MSSAMPVVTATLVPQQPPAAVWVPTLVAPGQPSGDAAARLQKIQTLQAADAEAARLRRLQGILEQFEITVADANDLVALEGYKIVCIADDSGSMQRPAAPPHMRRLGERSASRWDELKDTISLIVELGCCFDTSGVDVYFLNRGNVKAVRGGSDPRLAAYLEAPPAGSTPLTEMLQAMPAECGGERPVILFILTDGVPNGGAWPFSRVLTGLVRKQITSYTFKAQIMACTGDDGEIGWLNDLDRQLPEVDVTDDFYTERQEVLRAGRVTRFTRGDWCMKAMLGPVLHKFDAWDEGYHKVVPPQCDLFGACTIS